MIITYKNFTIEEDRSCYILIEHGVKEKGENIGEEYIKDQIFPSTLAKALEHIAYRLRKNDSSQLELEEYIQRVTKINEDFLIDVKDLCK